MMLCMRIDRLEASRPEAHAGSGLALDLSPDLCARIAASQAAGTFPQSLTYVDLEAILTAADVARGQA